MIALILVSPAAVDTADPESCFHDPVFIFCIVMPIMTEIPVADAARTAAPPKLVTAALLIIGNEILSGRTKDANLAFLGENLNEIGIQMSECRVVRDDEADIIAAVRALSDRYDYVFTTGGIGPTHDDITCSCIAKAFGADVIRHPEAMRLLTAHYQKTGVEFNAMRQRMANIPVGAELIDNPVSVAPGFRIANVYVMAGVPRIMQGMFDELRQSLSGGEKKTAISIPCPLGEGVVAAGLQAVQERYPDIDIGSYPFFRMGQIGTNLVLRGFDLAVLARAADEVREVVRAQGVEPEDPVDDSAAMGPGTKS